jgi:hypothetical protein
MKDSTVVAVWVMIFLFVAALCGAIWLAPTTSTTPKACGAYAETPVSQVPARCFTNFTWGDYSR